MHEDVAELRECAGAVEPIPTETGGSIWAEPIRLVELVDQQSGVIYEHPPQVRVGDELLSLDAARRLAGQLADAIALVTSEDVAAG
ncbi:hypothetical protein AB0H43_10570 [Hamadaea sp. NPDC050747]|uniref:hypothetical protein n=1 Tax=Hamadaea sp. NPDC050747 TaxID=3155789 RepID=UPI0033DD395B